MRRFPVHSTDRKLIADVPWDMVAQHEKQAKANHDQSLEQLAERGGLSITELAAVLADAGLAWLLCAGSDSTGRAKSDRQRIALAFVKARVELWGRGETV